jgi:hypothetical protein
MKRRLFVGSTTGISPKGVRFGRPEPATRAGSNLCPEMSSVASACHVSSPPSADRLAGRHLATEVVTIQADLHTSTHHHAYS